MNLERKIKFATGFVAGAILTGVVYKEVIKEPSEREIQSINCLDRPTHLELHEFIPKNRGIKLKGSPEDITAFKIDANGRGGIKLGVEHDVMLAIAKIGEADKDQADPVFEASLVYGFDPSLGEIANYRDPEKTIFIKSVPNINGGSDVDIIATCLK